MGAASFENWAARVPLSQYPRPPSPNTFSNIMSHRYDNLIELFLQKANNSITLT